MATRTAEPEPRPVDVHRAAGATSAPHAAGRRLRAAVPWFPGWAREFADQYFAGTTCVFVLHGNVHDLIRAGGAAGAAYGSVTEFLATQLFGTWDVVLRHDLSQGLKAAAGARRRSPAQDGRLARRADRRAEVLAPRSRRDPRRCSTSSDPGHPDGGRPGQADQPGHHPRLCPVPGPLGRAEPDGRPPRERGWSGCSPGPRTLTSSGTTSPFCLLCDQLAEINERLIGSAHVATLEVADARRPAREEFVAWYDSHDGKLGNLTDFTPKQLAELTAGLNLVNLERLLARRASRARSSTPRPQAPQEGADRAAGAGPGRVRRAAAHARRLRRQRRRQAAAGRRRGRSWPRAGSTPRRWAI